MTMSTTDTTEGRPATGRAGSEVDDLRRAYLQLVQRSLQNDLYPEAEGVGLPVPPPKRWPQRLLYKALAAKGLMLRYNREVDLDSQRAGRNWPLFAHTMIGYPRLDNLHECVRRVVEDDVPGDLIE